MGTKFKEIASTQLYAATKQVYECKVFARKGSSSRPSPLAVREHWCIFPALAAEQGFCPFAEKTSGSGPKRNAHVPVCGKETGGSFRAVGAISESEGLAQREVPLTNRN